MKNVIREMAVFMKIKYFSYKIARSNTGRNTFLFSVLLVKDFGCNDDAT